MKVLASVLLFLAFVGEPLLANPVLVLHGGETAVQGLARREGDTCRILIIGSRLANGDEARIVGTRGSRGSASFERVVETAGGTLTMLTVTAGADSLCTDSELGILQAVTDTTLVLRNPNGGLDLFPVATLYESDRVIGLASRGETGQLDERMQGALVMEQGLHKGLLTTVDLGSEGRLAAAWHVDDLVDQLGSWFRLPPPLVDTDRALEVLDQASTARPTGDVGQVAAAERLVRQGSELSGMDLAGLSFENASLSKAQLSRAVLNGASFERAVLRQADLPLVQLSFAELAEARFEGANLEGSVLYFASADRAVFDEIRGFRSNWTGASARGASFRQADLRGASFKFTDLTDADFTGADLTETLFIGAILEGAIFTDATVRNTDLTSAYGDAAAFSTEQQRELCATEFSHQGDGHVTLTRVVPSTRFDSGKDYQRFATGTFDYELGLFRLDPCKARQQRTSGHESVYDLGGREFIKTMYDFHFPSALLDKGGRRGKFETRFRDQLKRLDEAVDRGQFVEVPGEVRQAITAALEQKLGNTAPLSTDLPLDEETAFLLALRSSPDFAAAQNWQGQARWHFRKEKEIARRDDRQPRWPQFFPSGYHEQQLGSEHAELFKRWTLARARDMPRLFYLSFRSPYSVGSLAAALGRKYEPVPDPSMAVLPLSEVHLEHLPQPLLDEVGPDSHGFLNAGGAFFTDIAIILEHPLERYRLDMPAEFAVSLGRRPGQVELRLRVKDVELVEIKGQRKLDHETYAVLHSELVGMRLINEQGDAYPEELPKKGTHPLSTLRQAATKAEFLRTLCAKYDEKAEERTDLRRKVRLDISELPWLLENDPHAEQLETQLGILAMMERFKGYTDILADYYLQAVLGEAPNPNNAYWRAVAERFTGDQSLLEPHDACRSAEATQ